MFSVDAFVRLNMFLRGVYRMAYLNLLWCVTTLLGLVVFGAGPATYAVAAYVDRWFRFGETPPVTRAFIASVRAEYWRSAAMGWILMAALTVVTANVFILGDWFLRFANVIALVVIGIIAAYVFPVMAATDLPGLRRPISAALLIGVGSLHWTITAAAAVAATSWLLTTFALPALVLFGIGIPATAIGLVTRAVFTPLTAPSDVPTAEKRTPALSLPMIAKGTTTP